MAANTIKLTTLTAAVVLVAMVEWSAPWLVHVSGWPKLTLLGAIRVIEIFGLIGVILFFEEGLGAVGWAPRTWKRGLIIGTLWALAFALSVAAAMALIHLNGGNPFSMIRGPLPVNRRELLIFFLVGGFIAPIAEELCFRGLIYSFFRRWGILTALSASTIIFVALHSVHGFPVVQLIGGLMFALAFEFTGNLMVPMVLHICGNSAIFALSLPLWSPLWEVAA